MEIAKVFLTGDTTGEIVFNSWFLTQDGITQVDIIQDIMGDLIAALENMGDGVDFLTALEKIDECESESVNLVLQRLMYKDY